MNNFTLPHQTITFMPLGKEKEHSASSMAQSQLELQNNDTSYPAIKSSPKK